MPYGAYLRLPASVADGLAATQARRLRLPGVPRVIVIFHPLQYPLARGLIAQHPDAELWYWRWDRYEVAYDASPRQRARLEDLHLAATLRAATTVVVSEALGELDPRGGRRGAAGAAGRRLLPRARAGRDRRRRVARPPRPPHRLEAAARARASGMPELVLLLIGAWHEDESGGDPDFQACRARRRTSSGSAAAPTRRPRG